MVECNKDTNITVNSGNTNRYYDWINLRNPLGQHGTTGQPYSLAFRVKFWVPAHLILQESVRNIFYMQARIDLLEGRLRANDWESAAKLGALLAQGDDLKFDPNALTCDICTPSLPTDNRSDRMTYANANISETASSSNIGCATAILGGGGVSSTNGNTISKSKKRKLSKQKSTIDDDDEPDTNNRPIIVLEYSPLRIYDDYVIYCDYDSAGDMPIDFTRRIAVEHGKLIKMSAKSARYWLLESIFKLSGFGEETFSGIVVSSASTSSTTLLGLTTSPSSATQHHDTTAQRCDISVGPHGLLIAMPDEQTR